MCTLESSFPEPARMASTQPRPARDRRHPPRPSPAPRRASAGPSLLPARALVDVHEARAVTRFGAEASSSLAWDGIWHDVEKLYATGLHPAIALNVSWQGRPVLDRTIGHVENEPRGPTRHVATPDTLFNLFSASKIVTATLVHALVDDGVLGLDMRPADFIPEFGSHGKDRIRLRHLLDHTAGIPDMPPGLDVEAALRAGRVPLQPLCDIHPVSPPGQRVAYAPVTSWVIVQEMVERATGRSLGPLLRERILDPLGFVNMGYGVSPERVDEVARHAVTGPPVPPIMNRIFRRTVGVDLDTAVPITNSPTFLTAVLPSANVIGTPREVTRFLEMLRRGGELDGVRVLSEAAVRRATTHVTPRQFDGTFGFPMRYGLGVMMGGRRFSLFGLNTAGAFGHLGLSTVVIFVDPHRDLSVTFLNTGKPMMDLGMVRWYQVLQRIAGMVPRR